MRPVGLTLLLALLPLGCAPSPEDLVRDVLREAALAAEEERVDDLTRLVSVRYEDDDGRTRDGLVRLATDYVARRRPVHLLVAERRLGRIGKGEGIEVELLVAAASVPLESLFDVSRASADVGVVTLSFLEESPGAWRIARADWRPATAADLLPAR
jgi:hypothetical protein